MASENAPSKNDAPAVSRSADRDAPSLRADFGSLFEQVYAQLRAMAQQQMAHERPGHTIHATELVHQAYLRLYGSAQIDWVNQRHFVHAAAEAMRRILIEHARSRSRAKRGGGMGRVTLSIVDAEIPAPTSENSEELLALDEALWRLEQKDPRAADVVRLRFFAGLTIQQTAETMGLSERTVKREWEFSRAWLSQALQ
jgi:RNA polymerase sigma factor (TIGR02999 family)